MARSEAKRMIEKLSFAYLATIMIGMSAFFTVIFATHTIIASGESAEFQDVRTQKILSIERLAEMSRNPGNGEILISELNWKGPDSMSIVFEIRGESGSPSMWMATLDTDALESGSSNSSVMLDRINFPFEQFSDILNSYRISGDDNSILFSAIENPENPDSPGGLFNLFKYNFLTQAVSPVTNYTSSPGNLTSVQGFDWMPDGGVIYETRNIIYQDPESPDEVPAEYWTIWRSANDAAPVVLWNGTINVRSDLAVSPDGKKVAFGSPSLAVAELSEGVLGDDSFRSLGQLSSDETLGATQSGPKWSKNSQFILHWQSQYETNATKDMMRSRPMIVATSLVLTSTDNATDEIIARIPQGSLGNPLPPVGISPDGRFVTYAISFLPFNPNTGTDTNPDEAGIYVTDFGTKRIPEFPAIAAPGIIAVGIATALLIAITRLGKARIW